MVDTRTHVAQFDLWEEKLRAGAGLEVSAYLKRINAKELRRTEYVRFANLARRVGLPELALRVLNPVVRPEKKGLRPATAEERVEYALSLFRIGANREGLGILEAPESAGFRDILLQRAIGLIYGWRYAEAIPLLKQYLAQAKAVTPDPYLKAVAQVNLVASLVFQMKLDEASSVLDEVRHLSRSESFRLLLGNCLELQAQIFINQEKYREASRFLRDSTDILKDTGQIDAIWVRKWRAVIEDRMAGRHSAKSRSPLLQLQAEAMEKGAWETARDCDYHYACARGDERLLTHLYFGTQFQSFRERVILACPDIPETYDWQLGERASRRIFRLDVGEELDSAIRLKGGQSLHRALSILASDFYRPFRLASLFSELFPEDYYDPRSSPDRVFQTLQRLRRWFEQERIPLVIQETGRAYRLLAKSPYCLRITKVGPIDAERIALRRLRSRFGEEEFTRDQAQDVLQLSKSSVHRLLKYAVDHELASSIGSGPGSRYSIRKP